MPTSPDHFTEFPAVSRDAWQRALRLNPSDTYAASTDPDQLQWSAVHTFEDLPPLSESTSARSAPTTCTLEAPVDQVVNQEILLAIIRSGVNGISLPAGISSETFKTLREHEHPFKSVSWRLYQLSRERWADYLNYFRRLPDSEAARGTIYLPEPLPGETSPGKTSRAELLTELTYQAQDLPTIRTVAIDGSTFHHQGASVIYELAMTLSRWVADIDELTDRGLSADTVLARSEITLATGTDFFPDVAKYRAFRALSQKMSEAYLGANLVRHSPLLRAVSGMRNKTYYDPDSNMLRNTTEALAAVIGGVDTLRLLPHDFLHTSKGKFGRRMATNVYHILHQEAHVGKVRDPAAGSYFLEGLTSQLVEKGWALFLDFEAQGGFWELWKRGTLVDHCREQANRQESQVATHRKIVVGATRYANHKESTDGQTAADHALRWAKALERIRLHHDASVSLGNLRPTLALWTQRDITSAALINQRANYVKDVLAAAGLAYQEHALQQISDFEPEPSANELGFVFCGSDAFYQSTVVDVLRNSSSDLPIRWIVGGAPEVVEAVRSAGITGVLGMGHDLVSLLNLTINPSAYEA